MQEHKDSIVIETGGSLLSNIEAGMFIVPGPIATPSELEGFLSAYIRYALRYICRRKSSRSSPEYLYSIMNIAPPTYYHPILFDLKNPFLQDDLESPSIQAASNSAQPRGSFVPKVLQSANLRICEQESRRSYSSEFQSCSEHVSKCLHLPNDMQRQYRTDDVMLQNARRLRDRGSVV